MLPIRKALAFKAAEYSRMKKMLLTVVVAVKAKNNTATEMKITFFLMPIFIIKNLY
ncbi:MAG: hypothetical protein M0P73_05815 [Syntrophobacterales bacterium]|nr:hypothetical protein [Syntrophobacterales bacterium]